MTNEEKITHIRMAAMEEARAEVNAIIKQHEDALRSVFEQQEKMQEKELHVMQSAQDSLRLI